jgi:hypothetical protein
MKRELILVSKTGEGKYLVDYYMENGQISEIVDEIMPSRCVCCDNTTGPFSLTVRDKEKLKNISKFFPEEKFNYFEQSPIMYT